MGTVRAQGRVMDLKGAVSVIVGEVRGYIDDKLLSFTKSVLDLERRVDEFQVVKEVDPQAIATLVLEAIPAPKDGEPGKDAEVTNEQLAKAVTSFFIENPIHVPQDGKSVAVDDVLPELKAELQRAFDAISIPKDGKDADPEKVAELVTEQVTKAVEELPKPADGKDGRNAFEVAASLGFDGDVYAWQDSLRGEKGVDGNSVTADDVLPELKVELQKAVAAIPIPKDGKDSTVKAEDFRTLFEAEHAKSLLDYERRFQDMIQRSIDRMPKPKDGRDALDLEHFKMSLSDDERTLTLALIRGDDRVEQSVRLSHPLYLGVYQPGRAYFKGDSVTFGGSTFIATRDNNSKPETDDAWKLSVKRGRDGKDGDKGDKGDPGPRGKGT